MRIVRWFFGLLVLAALGAGAVYYYAGTMDGPAITINQPTVVGQSGTLDVTLDAPGAEFMTVSVEVEQKGKTFAVLDIGATGDHAEITRPIGKKTLPELESGPATLKVSASRPVLFGIRQVSSESSREIQVRLTPPRVGVVSTHHYVNQGGAEMIVYRVAPRRRRVGRAGRRCHLPRVPGKGCRAERSRAQGGVLRAALQPGDGHADGSVRER